MDLTWNNLNEQIENCKNCSLYKTCTNKVPGAGSKNATVMFIGEGPGRHEDEQGIPFVGAAGKLLTRMLASISLNRDEIYIGNVVKCRPPNNREPSAEEASACLPLLRAQLYLIKPKIIVLLGATAMRTLLGPDHRITKEHGQWFHRAGVDIMATYHPAALLYRPENKYHAWEDLKILKKRLDDLKKENESNTESA